MTAIKLSDLHPNPFRDLVRLPTKPAKIEALKQSIKTTEFWDNLIARKRPNGAGGYEIAYGHNRLEALRQLKWSDINIPVRDLSDATMLKVMANENMEEWGATSDVEQETVRAVVTAFAEKKIELPPITNQRGPVRAAPSFCLSGKLSGQSESFYSADTVAQFLGWKPWKIETALNALSLIEKSLLCDEDFAGLTPAQTEAVVRETRRVVKEADDTKLATAIGKKLADGMRHATGRPGVGGKKQGVPKQDVTVKSAKARANELMREARVTRRQAVTQAKVDKLNLQKENRQVKQFLDACKVFKAAMQAAGKATSKFSPEAKRFSIRRLSELSSEIMLLKGRLG